MAKGDFGDIGKKRAAPQNVDAFVESATADGTSNSADPRAKRDYKNLRIGLNRHEYELLEKAAQRDGMTLVGFIRSAFVKKAKGI
ncbi:hypothetical protein HNQ57_003578 [Zhongshania antarctica]|uniref:Uncharacterized protein n=1 Tax=Zhongshania antarctica TaxID=641702 RepID=A0A840R7N6_9GAMM|nr:hypothetical protein [Zhongshania antarctica]MBB5189275.1 hypothetical protein [Zhongshania antarctica]